MSPLRFSILLLIVHTAFGQEFRATLQGTITDPSQAVVPGAMVALHNVDTAIERQEVADSEGHYLFPFVPPGNYSLTVTATGFKTYVQDRIVLSVSQNARQDVLLILGTSSETGSVTTDLSLVQA